MFHIEKLRKVNKNIWFLVILFFSSCFYLYNINFSNLWIDEAFTKALVKHSFTEISGLIKNDFHPPLYFYGLKIFVTVFGISDFSVRLFSVLGVIFSIVLGYTAGQRLFGKSGALYFCLLLLSLPMLAAYSHEARMYTWGAFTVTGVFLYACLFITTNKKNDLFCLMLFSLLTAYTHYYSLLAACLANIFVLIFLLIRKNINWRVHLFYSLITIILYLPWIIVLYNQFGKVRKSFWVPQIEWGTILSCFLSPFAQKYFLPPSYPMVIIFFGITLWTMYRSFLNRKDDQRIILGLSFFIFGFTVLIAAAVSLIYQPILYPRYIANIAVMLIVPPTIYFMTTNNKYVKVIILTAILSFGLINSIESSAFSFGPYEQSLSHLHNRHPEVKKIFHVLETTGSFIEYSSQNFDNYWFCPESTVVYTNMDVFYNLHTTTSLNKVLKDGEPFCVVNFPNMPFNENNFQRIISESRLTTVDTIVDNKMENGFSLLLYILKYNGNKSGTISGI